MFEVENADCPPSLSEHGVLRSGKKSDLLSCLEVYSPSDFDEADGKLIDGASMVHVLRQDASIMSFRDYTDKKVIPNIETQLANTKKFMSYGIAICQTVYKQPPERGGEQESDSGCDMMGMGNFREIGTYLQNASNKVKWLHYLPVAIAKTVFCEGKMM